MKEPPPSISKFATHARNADEVSVANGNKHADTACEVAKDEDVETSAAVGKIEVDTVESEIHEDC